MQVQTEISTSASDEVKSKAIVKYSVPCPARFAKLQCNTDLNLPPSNWLSSSVDSYGLQHVLYQPQGFSSFRMAHMFPDCVGEVDVVSDAENIKNLLKIPYHKGSVSMMVHRVENTLLLDDFDIYKHILRTAETEWEWLRRFFYDNFKNNVNSEPQYDGSLYFKSKSRKALKQKSLISKFLYHSLVDSDEKGELNFGDGCEIKLPLEGPVLPEPSHAEEVPDPASQDHKYNRNVIWTFEDIQMLLGTDMPIFGGGTHPCISLRLRDMSKPINVLTGIDYWLDNLMSNVPEVVMCYHLNGIVQKYELIKTEDLPRLDNSKFSPKVIREVAKSILSFLKSNATKAGHTYWLFKPKDQDVVKLYDLTSLCSKYMIEKDENPFTVPVAMLLYRVARNMKHSCERQPGVIRMLLKNCVKLLAEEKYPEIVTSSHFMLSDLYIPAGTDPRSCVLDETELDDIQFVFDDDLPAEDEDASSTKTLILDSNHLRDKFANYYKPPPPIAGSVEERCSQALFHVVFGLDCLKYFGQPSCNSSSTQAPKDEENVPMAKPHEPIPMPYSSINNIINSNDTPKKRSTKKRKERSRKKSEAIENEKQPDNSPTALLLKNKVEPQPLPTWQDPNHDNITWKDHLKLILYEKAVLVYATLVEQHFHSGKYGASFRCLGLLVRSREILSKMFQSINTITESCLLGRAGDCCVMIVQNWNKIEDYQNQFSDHQDEDLKMMQQLEMDERFFNIKYVECSMKCVLIYEIRTIEQMLLKGVECYKEALKYGECESMLSRLGNSLNEIGSFYSNRARTAKEELIMVDACNKAETYFNKGLEMFKKSKDDSNMALLYANMGHLHRVLAHAKGSNEKTELTNQQKLHYSKAFMNYKKALQVLGNRSGCPEIWDALKWDLSTALFTMATALHDNPNSSLNRTEAEREVTENLHVALKHCDLDEKNPKFPLYQFRAGLLHYRLGSLYHSSIWNLSEDPVNKKNTIHLAKLHYDKAANLFFASNDAINYLTAQMQRFALLEYLAEIATVPQIKINNFGDCLEILFEVIPTLQLIIENKIDYESDIVEETNASNSSFKNLRSLVNLIKDRTQYVLRLLTKLCLSKPPTNKDCPRLADVYKSSYALTLTLTDKLEFCDIVAKLRDILLEIKNMLSTSNTSG